MNRVFLDTGPLVAAVHRRDAHHGDARRLLHEIASGTLDSVHTSDLVLLEAVNFIVARIKQRRSLEALARLVSGDQRIVSHVHHVDAAMQAEAFARTLGRFEEGLSLTDRTILALMEQHRVPRLATYDRGFEGRVETVAM